MRQGLFYVHFAKAPIVGPLGRPPGRTSGRPQYDPRTRADCTKSTCATSGGRIVFTSMSHPTRTARSTPSVWRLLVFERNALGGIQWVSPTPPRSSTTWPRKPFKQAGAVGELKPLDLKVEPDLQALLAEVDLSNLEGE